MKKLLFALVLAVGFFACQKKDIAPAGSTAQYTVETKDSIIFPSTGDVTYSYLTYTVGNDTASVFVAKNTYSKIDSAYYTGQLTSIIRQTVSCYK